MATKSVFISNKARNVRSSWAKHKKKEGKKAIAKSTRKTFKSLLKSPPKVPNEIPNNRFLVDEHSIRSRSVYRKLPDKRIALLYLRCKRSVLLLNESGMIQLEIARAERVLKGLQQKCWRIKRLTSFSITIIIWITLKLKIDSLKSVKLSLRLVAGSGQVY